MLDLPHILKHLDESSRRIETVSEGWALQADADRRHHHREDERSIEEMLELIVLNSILFGEDRPVDDHS